MLKLQRHWVIRLATLPIRIVIIAASIIELILRPLYRPLVRAIVGLGLFARMERWIGSLPRLAILMLLAVPFAVAEPMKVVAVVMIAEGHVTTGTALLVLSYLATFLIVERIYHAGRSKLLTYRWLAWIMKYVGMALVYYGIIKDAALAPARAFTRWFHRKFWQ